MGRRRRRRHGCGGRTALSPGGRAPRVVDSHAHLDSCDVDVADVIDEARQAGVDRVVTIGVGERSSRWAVETAEAHDEVWVAVGVHPNDANAWTDADATWIRELAAHPRVVAIGECGLDYYRDHATREAQDRAFRAQIRLAGELGLPLVIHTRDATADTLARLESEAAGRPVILHCFSITEPEFVDRVIDAGWYASFAGPLTYRRNDALREAAARIPAERLLVETDSPYLAPEPRRGRPNRPANVAHTLTRLAEVRGLTIDEADALTTANAARVFGW
ncbi:MAG: TatD family hydrolase [Thermoleophilia bacterium]